MIKILGIHQSLSLSLQQQDQDILNAIQLVYNWFKSQKINCKMQDEIAWLKFGNQRNYYFNSSSLQSYLLVVEVLTVKLLLNPKSFGDNMSKTLLLHYL